MRIAEEAKRAAQSQEEDLSAEEAAVGPALAHRRASPLRLRQALQLQREREKEEEQRKLEEARNLLSVGGISCLSSPFLSRRSGAS